MRDFIRDVAGFGNLVGFRKTLLGISKDVVIILLEVMRLIIVDEITLGLPCPVLLVP